MTDAWNWAEAGGAAAAKNQAQPIRQDMRSFCLFGAGLNILPLSFCQSRQKPTYRYQFACQGQKLYDRTPGHHDHSYG